MKKLVIFLLTLGTALFSSSSFATVIHVPGDYPTIQQAIDATTDGDTVLVQPGTYVENINFNGHNIVLGSLFLTTGDTAYIATTIIDGGASGVVVVIANGEDNNAVITGFTIQNGYGYEGGFKCHDSSPTINYNIINGNTAISNGGGISCTSANPTISNNTITGNSSDYQGGGISCHNSNPVITNTIIWGDSAPTGPEIYLSGTSSPVITYCDVQGGWAGEGNIDCYPMFCGADSGNYYLDAASCCVGAGEGGVDIGVCGVGCDPIVINIPADYGTIQEGIHASSHGDTVLVAPGTYVENILFYGHNIVLGSLFLTTGDTSYISSTIIDGGSTGAVLSIIHGEDTTANITGFTIQNGNATYGGGIYCIHSSPTISNNTIRGNSAGYGGGIASYDSNSPINYNTIIGNSASWSGGGIKCAYSGTPISNNTISGNSAGWYGGGIDFDNSSPAVTNTIFWGNSAPSYPEIFLHTTSTPVITYCDVQGGWAGEGNINCDPMFCDSLNGDYAVDRLSCCIGAGENGVNIGANGVGCWTPMTINVPADYSTIQEGIDASFDGDTVRVASGTYVENINFSGKNIVVGSWFLDDGDTSFISSTIIDGGASGSVVTFENGEYNTAIITGFTIQNGLTDAAGGGIRCGNSNPIISYNTINGNSALFDGGGIACFNNSSPEITNNTISGNTAELWSAGGGIYCGSSNPTISNNTISGNRALEDGSGGGIYCLGSSPTISNNTISENTADFGGGICCYNSSPVITNTIFWADSAPNGPEIYLVGGSPVITYCDVQGGWSGEGNIDCDPMFCYPDTGNYYLYDSSCCVGAGCDSLGNPDSTVDIGAFGVGCSFVRGDVNGDGVVNVGDVVYLVNYLYRNGDPPIPMEAGDANCDGVVNVGDVVYLVNYLYRGGDPPGC